jgi:hypothetical protein
MSDKELRERWLSIYKTNRWKNDKYKSKWYKRN